MRLGGLCARPLPFGPVPACSSPLSPFFASGLPVGGGAYGSYEAWGATTVNAEKTAQKRRKKGEKRRAWERWKKRTKTALIFRNWRISGQNDKTTKKSDKSRPNCEYGEKRRLLGGKNERTPMAAAWVCFRLSVPRAENYQNIRRLLINKTGIGSQVHVR